MQYVESRPSLMDKQSQFLVIFSGTLGLTLAILTATPKRTADAVIAVLSGLFGSLFIAPAIAEALTNFAGMYPTFGWLNASPGTATFAAIVGFGGMLGFQIVVLAKNDFINWVKQFARKRSGTSHDSTIHESDS